MSLMIGIDMKRIIILAMVCITLIFSVACGDNASEGMIPPFQNEQTEIDSGESTDNDASQEPEEDESENKGKPVTPIQNGGTITTN